MLGLSIGKLLVIILIVLALWRGMRMLQEFRDRAVQLERQRAAGRTTDRAREREGERQPTAATDLVKCPRCGTYVPNGTICRSTEECQYRAR